LTSVVAVLVNALALHTASVPLRVHYSLDGVVGPVVNSEAESDGDSESAVGHDRLVEPFGDVFDSTFTVDDFSPGDDVLWYNPAMDALVRAKVFHVSLSQETLILRIGRRKISGIRPCHVQAFFP
jgi:hypothetical protein